MRRLDAKTRVAGQIRPDDMTRLAAEGVTLIVNNRPDGEEAGQPPASEVEAAARAAGLGYRHIPVAGGISEPQIAAMAEALAAAEGEVVAFCRSGTRSAFLWALAEARRGADPEVLVRAAADAGYDLAPIRRWL